MIKGWTTEIYNRLSVILSWEDHWEIRLRSLEAFVDERCRLPSRKCDSKLEMTLGMWLDNQRGALRMQRLPLHRFQKLLASSPLIRRRAEGWQTGSLDGFRQRCYELGEYVQLHHQLPDLANPQIGSSSWKLAKWVSKLRVGQVRLEVAKMKLLQDAHPLVKAELQKWRDAPRLYRSQAPAWVLYACHWGTRVRVPWLEPEDCSCLGVLRTPKHESC